MRRWKSVGCWVFVCLAMLSQLGACSNGAGDAGLVIGDIIDAIDKDNRDEVLVPGDQEPVKEDPPGVEIDKPEAVGDGAARVGATYYGLTNGGLPTWYFWEPMSSFPDQFTLVVEGYATVEVINNGRRFEGGGLVVKESEVPVRGMGVITLHSSSARTCYIIKPK